MLQNFQFTFLHCQCHETRFRTSQALVSSSLKAGTMSFSKFSRSNVTQADGNGKAISNLTSSILKTWALCNAPHWACTSSEHIEIRETSAHTPSRAQASHPGRHLRVEALLYHWLSQLFGQLPLNLPKSWLPPLENGDNRTR